MKTTVNLYQPSLMPQPQHYRFSSLLRLFVVILLILCALQLLLYWQSRQVQQQLIQQQQHINTKTSELDNLQQALANQQPDLNLQQKLQQLTTSNQQRQQLLQLLQHNSDEARPVFSQVMLDLARADRSGFWLTQFRLGAAQVSFRGVTREASQLPDWLQQIGQNAYLRQRSFAQVKLVPANDGYIAFEVNSESGAQP